MMKNNKLTIRSEGYSLVYSVVAIFIFTMVMLAVLAYATAEVRVSRSSVNRELALQIAEAGVNYYQWHLAHFTQDFWDGNATSTPGPYIHNYVDKDTNQAVGQFSLKITRPAVGSTIVTIASTGSTLANPGQKRTVTVRYGVPSLAKYAFLTNTDVWIGNMEAISGELHANGGIHFDGNGNAPIASSKITYTCQTYHGCSPAQSKPGIWGSAGASTQAFWSFPVPNVDFSSITSNLQDLETLATGQADLPPSSAQGYSLVFNSDGTVSVYTVTALRAHGDGSDVNGVVHSEDLDYNTRNFLYTMPIPANGVIFVKDHVWVEGVVNGRVVVGATKYSTNPSQQARIIIPNNLTYLVKDGNHSLGLIAEKDILISYYAPANLEVDAAMIAQNGSAQRYYFSGNTKTGIIIYGAVGSFGVWTWSWVNGSGTCISGYCNTNTTYDANLLYSPPPSFPLSADGYQQISWSSD